MIRLALAVAAVVSVVGLILVAPRYLVEELDERTDVLFRVDVDRPILALTIDDGPSVHTGEVLDVLAAHGVRATFFLIGERVLQYPGVVERISAEGHELGHHMMQDRTSVLLDEKAFEREFRETHRILSRFGDPEWFRPGGGWYDGSMVERARSAGYRVALASMLPLDAHLPFPGVIGEYVEYHARPGAILVLHDGPGSGESTAEVLRELLPELDRDGLKATTVGDLVEAGDRFDARSPELGRNDAAAPDVSRIGGGVSDDGHP